MANQTNTSPTVQYIGNGTTKEFAFLRPSWEKSDIYVFLGDTQQTSGYLLKTEDITHGATVVFDEPPAKDVIITITRILRLERSTHFEESGAFKADVINHEFDRIIAMIQQVNDTSNRNLTMPLTAGNVNTNLPTPEAGKALVWDDDKKQLRNSKDKFDDIIANNTILATSVAANASHALNSKNSAANSAEKALDSQNKAAKIAEDMVKYAEVLTNEFDENAYAKTLAFNENAREKNEITTNAMTATLEAEERCKIIAEGSQEEILSLNNTLARSAMDWALLAAHNSAGIVPDNCKKMRIKRNGRNVGLKWQDPNDTSVEGQIICTWHATYIVRQENRYPENAEDGEIVLVNTERNAYENKAFTLLEPDDGKTYYYAAFPASSEGARNLSRRNRFGLWVFGFAINEDDPVEATCVEYPDDVDNRFYLKSYMDFKNDTWEFGDWDIEDIMPRPCMLKFDGTVDYYLDKNDINKKEDGTNSDIANVNYNGNAMVQFPRVFTKKWRSRNKRYCLFSNVKLDNDFECWSCKKSDGTYADYFYGPMFEGVKDVSGRMRSLALNQKATASTTAEAEMNACRANGNGWDMTYWSDEDYWRDLLTLITKRLNMQAAIGFGATGSTTGLTTNTGCAKNKNGAFWGAEAASPNGMKAFYMENFFAHRWRRFLGCLLINGTFWVKMTRSKVDGSTVDDFNLTGNGYINTGIKAPSASESYIKKVAAGKYGGLPVEVGGSSSTYYCDAMWTNLSGTMMPLSGGSVYNGVFAGAFAFFCNYTPSNSVWNCGGSLSYHTL